MADTTVNANINFRLNTQSITPALTSLQNQLRNQTVTIPVNFQINQNQLKQIQDQTGSFKALSSTLNGLAISAGKASTSMAALGQTIGNIGSSINAIGTSTATLRSANTAIAGIGNTATTTGRSLEGATKQAQSFAEAIGVSAKRFSTFAIAAAAISTVVFQFGNAVKAAIDFDAELVKFKQVGGDTAPVIQSISKEITRLSTSLGVSSKDLVEASVTLRQAQLTARETKIALDALAKTTVAPTFKSIQNTTEGVIAVLNIFGKGVGALEGQLGAINKVAADFPVEAADIIEALRRSGAAFKATGGSMEELIGLFTAVRSTTRESAESIATSLRTIFARLERPRTLTALRSIGVDLQDVQGNAIGGLKAIEKLYTALKKEPPGSIKFAQVVEEIGGIRQFEKVIPLITQFPLALEAYNTAISKEAKNSLNKDVELGVVSFARKLSMLKETFLDLFRVISNNAVLNGFLTNILNVSTAIVGAVKSLEPVIPIIAGFLAIEAAGGAVGFASRFKGGFQKRTFAEGGIIPEVNSGIQGRDRVPIYAEPGEFIITKQAARTIGYDTLHKANESAGTRFGNKPKGMYNAVGGGIIKFGFAKGGKIPSLEDIRSSIGGKTGPYGDERVLLRDAYNEIHSKYPGLSFSKFQEIVTSSPEGRSSMGRFDLVGGKGGVGLDPETLAKSSTPYLNTGEFHYIRGQKQNISTEEAIASPIKSKRVYKPRIKKSTVSEGQVSQNIEEVKANRLALIKEMSEKVDEEGAIKRKAKILESKNNPTFARKEVTLQNKVLARFSQKKVQEDSAARIRQQALESRQETQFAKSKARPITQAVGVSGAVQNQPQVRPEPVFIPPPQVEAKLGSLKNRLSSRKTQSQVVPPISTTTQSNSPSVVPPITPPITPAVEKTLYRGVKEQAIKEDFAPPLTPQEKSEYNQIHASLTEQVYSDKKGLVTPEQIKKFNDFSHRTNEKHYTDDLNEAKKYAGDKGQVVQVKVPQPELKKYVDYTSSFTTGTYGNNYKIPHSIHKNATPLNITPPPTPPIIPPVNTTSANQAPFQNVRTSQKDLPHFFRETQGNFINPPVVSPPKYPVNPNLNEPEVSDLVHGPIVGHPHLSKTIPNTQTHLPIYQRLSNYKFEDEIAEPYKRNVDIQYTTSKAKQNQLESPNYGRLSDLNQVRGTNTKDTPFSNLDYEKEYNSRLVNRTGQLALPKPTGPLDSLSFLKRQRISSSIPLGRTLPSNTVNLNLPNPSYQGQPLENERLRARIQRETARRSPSTIRPTLVPRAPVLPPINPPLNPTSVGYNPYDAISQTIRKRQGIAPDSVINTTEELGQFGERANSESRKTGIPLRKRYRPYDAISQTINEQGIPNARQVRRNPYRRKTVDNTPIELDKSYKRNFRSQVEQGLGLGEDNGFTSQKLSDQRRFYSKQNARDHFNNSSGFFNSRSNDTLSNIEKNSGVSQEEILRATRLGPVRRGRLAAANRSAIEQEKFFPEDLGSKQSPVGRGFTEGESVNLGKKLKYYNEPSNRTPTNVKYNRNHPNGPGGGGGGGPNDPNLNTITGGLSRGGKFRAAGIAAGLTLAYAAPTILEHQLGTAEKPGSYGTSGARTGSVLGSAIAGGATGALIGGQVGAGVGAAFGGVGAAPGAAIGVGLGALVGALTASVGALTNFNKELEDVQIKQFQKDIANANIDFGKGKFVTEEDKTAFNVGLVKQLPSPGELLNTKAASNYFHSSRKSKTVDNLSSTAFSKALKEKLGDEKTNEFVGTAHGIITKTLAAHPEKTVDEVIASFGKLQTQLGKFDLGTILGLDPSKREALTRFAEAQKEGALLQQKANIQIAQTVSEFEKTSDALTEFSQRLEGAAKQFHESGQIVESQSAALLSGKIAGSAGSPNISSLGPLGKEVEDFSKAGGGYDQNKSVIKDIIEKIQRNTKESGDEPSDRNDQAGLAVDLYKQTAAGQGHFSPTIEKQLFNAINEQGLKLGGQTTKEGLNSFVENKVLAPQKEIVQSRNQNNSVLAKVHEEQQRKEAERLNVDFEISQRKANTIAQKGKDKFDEQNRRIQISPLTQFNRNRRTGRLEQPISVEERISRERTGGQNFDEQLEEITGRKNRKFANIPELSQALGKADKNFENIQNFRNKVANDKPSPFRSNLLRKLGRQSENALVKRQLAQVNLNAGVNENKLDQPNSVKDLVEGIKSRQVKLADLDTKKQAAIQAGKPTEGIAKETAKIQSEIVRFKSGLESLALSTGKLDDAQEKYTIALSKRDNDLNARKSISEIATFGSQQEKAQFAYKENLTQRAIQVGPEAFQNIATDEEKRTVYEHLQNTKDLERQFYNPDKFGRIDPNHPTRTETGRQTIDRFSKQNLDYLVSDPNRDYGNFKPRKGSKHHYQRTDLPDLGIRGNAAGKLQENLEAANAGINNVNRGKQEASNALSDLQKGENTKAGILNQEIFKTFTDNLNKSIQQQMEGLMNFANNTKELVSALKSFPSAITIKREGKVEVILNGAQVLASFKGDLEQEITKQIVKQLKDKLPKALGDQPAK